MCQKIISDQQNDATPLFKRYVGKCVIDGSLKSITNETFMNSDIKQKGEELCLNNFE